MPDLFNTEPFARLHADRFSGPAIRHVAGDAVFQACPVGADRFDSPGRGPHGGFDVGQGLDDSAIEGFVQDTEAALRQAGAKTVTVVQPPLCHGPVLGLRVLTILCRLGYVVVRQELNQSLQVDTRDFAGMGNSASRKRARKAARLGVTTMRLDDADRGKAYRVLEDNRRKKGRTLSMTAEDVAAMATRFPDHVHVFGAHMGGDLVAAAICVAVNPRVLYVYAWGEAPGAEPVSPVTLLAGHVHGFAASSGFTVLDIGTSSVDGIVDPGLFAFKRSLGAESTPKVWLRKELAA